MSMTCEPGFYWAYNLDDGKLTVVRLWKCGDSLAVEILGRLDCPDLSEFERGWQLIEKIAEPPA